jgi:nucleoporin NUP82
MSWLDALSQHPVWTLPPAPPSLDDQDSLGDAAAAGTPAAQARAQATISHSASSQSLFGSTARKSTPAAAPPTSPAALARSTPFARSHRHAGTRSATKDRERRLRGARTSNVAVVRGADLVVAVGSELRIASLAQVKANARADYDEHALAEKDIGEYKVRTSTACGYDMLHGGPPSC